MHRLIVLRALVSAQIYFVACATDEMLTDGSYWREVWIGTTDHQSALDYGESTDREPPIDTSYGE